MKKVKDMENILKKLFDYQKFENNENLEKIIKDSQKKRLAKLSDDKLQLLNAAGDIFATNFSKDMEKKI